MAQPNTPRSPIRAPINAKILYSGILMKKGEFHKSWKERWFVLFDNRQCAYYHNREEFQDSKRPVSTIDLKQVTAIQPVNIDIHNQQKKSKKSIFGRSSSSAHSPLSVRRITDDVEDSYASQSSYTDSPLPSQSNSLRLSFKSLMGKKSHKSNKLSVEALRAHTNHNAHHSNVSDDFDEFSRNDSFHSNDDSADRLNIFQAEFPFEIVCPARTYLLCCLDAYSFNDWLEHLRNVTFGKKIYGGWLTKQGSKNKSWKKRWFVIFDTREIRYYDNEKTSQEKGSIILDDLQILNLLEDKQAKSVYKKKNIFELVCGGRKWVLYANSKEERELWFNRVVQVVPNVQRLDPLYSNELSYKRNDRAKKWMKGYFAMDVEYLFFFKNKASFDTFKSSAYFQEDLYTLALAQHVQGLIPLRNRKIKELDRNHPACSGKNKFVFSLKTSAGEFFLSTQYSIQMDDWLDAFRELYRLEVQEKRQGVISKRRKHSNSFGRRPPSPPSRAGSASFGRRPPSPRSTYSSNSRNGHRSISPTPSNTAYHNAAAQADDDEKRRHNRKNRGVAEAGNLKNNKNRSSKPYGTGYYNKANNIPGANQLKPNNINKPHKAKRKPRKKPKPPGRILASDDDNESPPAKGENASPAQHRRTHTPFKGIDNKVHQRRKSREKLFGDDAHYDMNTKNIPGKRKSGTFEINTAALNEGNEGSSGDSEPESNSRSRNNISEWQTKSKKKKRPKRRDKKRKQSVGQVLKNKISNMRSGKKQKKKEKEEAKKRKKSKERKEKEKKKEAKKEAKERKEREKRQAKNKRNAKTVDLKKMDPMKSLEQTKKEAKTHRKKKDKKERRRSVGDVLKGALTSSKKKEPEPIAETKKKETTTNLKASSGRKKRSEKVRRRSTGEGLVDKTDSDDGNENEVKNESKAIAKSNTLRAPKTAAGSGRKKRKDKTRRRSVNDVIKNAFSSKKKETKKEPTKKKEPPKPKKKKKDKGPRRVSLGDAIKDGAKKETENKNIKFKNRGKPTKISTNTETAHSSSSDSDERKKKKKKPPPGNNRRGRDTSDELAVYKNKINARTRKRIARHQRHETPQYDIATKDLLKQEYEAAFSGDDDRILVANEVLSEDAEEDDKTPVTPNPRGHGLRSYRKQQVEISDRDRDKKHKPPPSKKKTTATPTPNKNTRQFKKRRDREPEKKSKSFAVKKIGKKPLKGSKPKPEPVHRHKSARKRRNEDSGWRKESVDEDSDTESDSDTDSDSDSSEYTESTEYETGSTDSSEYTESTGSDDSGTTATESTGSTETGSEYTDDTDYESGDTDTGSSTSGDSESDSRTQSRSRERSRGKKPKAKLKPKTKPKPRKSDAIYDAIIADMRKKSSREDVDDWNKKKAHQILKDKKSIHKDKDKKSIKKNKDKDKESQRDKEKEKAKKKADEAAAAKLKKKREKEKERKRKEKEKEAAEKKEREREREKKRKLEAEKEKERKRKEAKQQQLKLEAERKQKEKEKAERERKRKQEENEYDDEDEHEEVTDEEEEDSSSEEEDSSDEDSLQSNSDDEQEAIDDAMKAYVELNNDTTAVLHEGDEHKEWERLEAAKRLQNKHKRKSTELWKWNTQQLIAEENDDPTANREELGKIWMKLRSIPKSSRKDSRETRIVKEFMMFQLNHDHSINDHYIIIENMNYPNIYQWNGQFIGPMGTPYVNGKYRIIIKFGKDYPSKPPKITFLTKIYNSSVKHNKRKKRGLLKLPKFFDRIWSKKISLRQWMNVVYEFLFFYCGDHFFDPMNQRVAREFIFAFDSFIDTCYQWNLIFADGYEGSSNMLQLHDEYGERQKLTFHCAKYSNQYDIHEYNVLKEIIWQIMRQKYKSTYGAFLVLLDYFGNEFYYCGLSELIREPHICVKHKVKRYDNIIEW